MDYAKLALFKAEELDKKNADTATKISRKGLIIQKSLAAGESLTLCKIKAYGEAAVMISLNFAESAGGAALNGNITLILDGKAVFSRPAAAFMLFTAPVAPAASGASDGEAAVKIKTDNAAVLLSADIMAIGAEIIGPAGADVKTDFSEGICCAVYESEGQIRLCADEKPPNLGDYVIAGFGQKPAVCAIKENGQVCLGVLFIEDGELVFSLFDKDKMQISCNYTGIRANSAALVRYGGGFAAGYTGGGFAYAGLLARPDFALGQVFRLEEASGIEFVKDAQPPAVILNKNGKNVIRTAQDEKIYDDSIRIRFECTAN